MSKLKTSWFSDRLQKEVTVVRWGEVGTPVLFFPTAAADAEECERFHMVSVLGPLLEAGRVKLYSVDSVAGRAWLTEDNDTANASRVQNQYDGFLRHELVPAIRQDWAGSSQRPSPWVRRMKRCRRASRWSPSGMCGTNSRGELSK